MHCGVWSIAWRHWWSKHLHQKILMSMKMFLVLTYEVVEDGPSTVELRPRRALFKTNFQHFIGSSSCSCRSQFPTHRAWYDVCCVQTCPSAYSPAPLLFPPQYRRHQEPLSIFPGRLEATFQEELLNMHSYPKADMVTPQLVVRIFLYLSLKHLHQQRRGFCRYKALRVVSAPSSKSTIATRIAEL